MFATPAEPTVFTVGSTVGRLSGFFYQAYLLPLLLALIALRLCAGKGRLLSSAAAILGTVAAAAGLYLLCAPVVGDFTQIATVSHVMLMVFFILYAAFFCPMPGHTKVVLAAAILADVNFAQSISTQIFMPLLSLDVSNALQLLLLVLALVEVYIFRPSDPDESIPAAYWLTMLVIAVLSTACLYAIRVLGGDRSLYFVYGSWLTIAVVLSAFFLVNLLIYYLYYVLVREYRTSASMKAMQAKLEQDLEFYRRSETVVKEYRSLRHELKNHIALMESLLRDKQYDKLEQYFADYAGKITPQLAEFRCPNPLVSSVISHQMNTARAAGVTLDVIAAVPETLGIADDDLCSVLSNMLDNGVEACLRAGKNLVRATLHTDRNCLFITVTNPVAADVLKENPELLTTKENTSSHGFGIPILRRITEKYDGIITFHVEDGWFTADAMMYMEDAT